MAEKLVQHRHCKACGKAVPPDDETCGGECEQRWKDKQKSRKQTLYMFYGSIVFMLVVLLLGLSGMFK
jgi:predicted nucleic acid-binding Zn ribbon protein